MTEERRRYIRAGEVLAMREEAFHYDADRKAFFWLFGPPVYENERCGSVCVVRVNGPLDHHDEGGGDCYESILSRLRCAAEGDEERGKPSAIVLRIDSPGGVVAGLAEMVRSMRDLRASSGIPIIAAADETAYSAAYALCSGCDETYLPKSGFVGSIGVISTMVDVTRADAKAGIRWVTLTSGRRKADGHPHVPITDEMVAVESPRVLSLAKQFYRDVSVGRGIPMRDLVKSNGFEAGRFLGSQAVSRGLADGTLAWTEVVSLLNERAETAPPKGTLAQNGTTRHTAPKAESTMTLKLDQLITETTKAIASEKDPVKLATLASNLESYKKTKHMIEKHETEEGDEDDDEEEESAEGDEDDRGDDPEDDEDEDDDGDDAESEEDSKKAFVQSVVTAAGITDKSKRIAFRAEVGRLVGTLAGGAAGTVYAAAVKLTGKRSPARVVAALEGAVAGAKDVKDRLAAIERTQRKERRENMVASALNARRITKHEAKTLRGKALSFVESFLEMRPKAIIDHDEAQMPVQGAKGGGTGLPDAVQKQLDDAAKHAKSMGLKNFDPQKVADEALKLNGKVPVV